MKTSLRFTVAASLVASGLLMSGAPAQADVGFGLPGAEVNCGFATCTVYLHRTTTQQWATRLKLEQNQNGLYAVAAFACSPWVAFSLAGAPGVAVATVGTASCEAIMLPRAGSLVDHATQAADSGQCLAIKQGLTQVSSLAQGKWSWGNDVRFLVRSNKYCKD